MIYILLKNSVQVLWLNTFQVTSYSSVCLHVQVVYKNDMCRIYHKLLNFTVYTHKTCREHDCVTRVNFAQKKDIIAAAFSMATK